MLFKLEVKTNELFLQTLTELYCCYVFKHQNCHRLFISQLICDCLTVQYSRQVQVHSLQSEAWPFAMMYTKRHDINKKDKTVIQKNGHFQKQNEPKLRKIVRSQRPWRSFVISCSCDSGSAGQLFTDKQTADPSVSFFLLDARTCCVYFHHECVYSMSLSSHHDR